MSIKLSNYERIAMEAGLNKVHFHNPALEELEHINCYDLKLRGALLEELKHFKKFKDILIKDFGPVSKMDEINSIVYFEYDFLCNWLINFIQPTEEELK